MSAAGALAGGFRRDYNARGTRRTSAFVADDDWFTILEWECMMIAIRKAWWATALLAAFAGCNTEEPGTGVNPPPPAAPSNPTAGSDSAAPKADEAAKPKDEAAPAKPDEAAKPDEKKEGEAAPAKADEKKDEEKKADAAPTKLSADEVAEIEKLPAEDKVLALKQIVCPVSDEALGSMGTPVKVTAEGKTFFLCCKGCNKEVETNAKDVVAKLKQK